MVKAELGTKRICPSCGSKFYDLMRSPVVCPKCSTPFDPEAFLQKAALGQTAIEFPKRAAIFSQGSSGDSVFYIQKGRVRVAVVSKRGKEATLALLGPGDFIGEDCIGLVQKRIASAIALTHCTLLQISRKQMLRAVHSDTEFSDMFVAYLLARNIRMQGLCDRDRDRVQQLFELIRLIYRIAAH